MTAEDAIRFLAYEAKECRDRNTHEAHLLLYPAILRVLQLQPMEAHEVRFFRSQFYETVRTDFRFDPEPSRVGCGGAT